MFGQLFSSQMQVGMIITLVLLLALYVLSIIWVMRDSYSRGANWKLWGLVALIPVAGLIAYLLLRPQLYLIDRDEQELEIAIKQRELLKYGECSRCGFPVQSDYLICPNCQQQLKTSCSRCGKPLDFKWKACPYCATPKPFQNQNNAVGTSARSTARPSMRSSQAAGQTQAQTQTKYAGVSDNRTAATTTNK